MKVTQISIGRFHHFHLARQMEKHGLLNKIYTGYPKFKLKDEKGIPEHKIKSFPWSHAPYMMKGKLGLGNIEWLNDHWRFYNQTILDKYVASLIKEPTFLISLSGSGLISGQKNQKKGGIWVCDRGSSHIKFQDDILKQEYQKWKIPFKGNDTRILEREYEEYEKADYITVPSKFVYDSFVAQGVPLSKLKKIPYGANVTRFHKTNDPDENEFSVLWVGQASIRKGFLYALDAFESLKVKNKKFTVIGVVENFVKERLRNYDLSGVIFKGAIPNTELKHFYSTHHVFILPSIEDGFGMVMAEALACGCPVIASVNTGAYDLFQENKEGFIIPIRDANVIKESFEKLIDQPLLRAEMSANALERVKLLGGWDTYGDNFKKFINASS
ncbi:glycosyltransferase family 4 protein [Wenyingzhuangia sp. 2_MG-2023]|uniref:glycosyltransferase family 4 protein n=1 Tax=Wenyingzhuangia sp. 2_MG-2023 TaxID=3062639 RepID=UPI0026E43545|nr:glycosyltransferase family 4 protein [Wenyingzhuangia sp. 2_MG-2023]MDO6739310.1 glycosyltransferase family 4 protein [Wenyingzhuangia sp. 2_MG-2023]